MIKVGSAIFNCDHSKLRETIAELDEAGIDFYHWDVFDSHFIPELAFAPKTIQAFRVYSKKEFAVHLGVNNVREHIKPLADAGVDLVFIPAEAEPLMYETIVYTKNYGISVGLSLAVGTPISSIEELLPHSECILLLCRAYGESTGYAYSEQAIMKLSKLKEAMDAKGVSIPIEIAGGLTPEIASEWAALGANRFAFGKTLHKDGGSIGKRLMEIKKIIGTN